MSTDGLAVVGLVLVVVGVWYWFRGPTVTGRAAHVLMATAVLVLVAAVALVVTLTTAPI